MRCRQMTTQPAPLPPAFEADDIIVRGGRRNLFRRVRPLQGVGGAVAIGRPIAVAKGRRDWQSPSAGRSREFAHAAERLGVDLTAPPPAVRGPQELRATIRAFNRMQDRLRRFLEDRTQMLAAISHDLRARKC